MEVHRFGANPETCNHPVFMFKVDKFFDELGSFDIAESHYEY